MVVGDNCGGSPHHRAGLRMRRAGMICLAGAALGGCASFSVPSLNFFTPTPTLAILQLESSPPGAEATTSAGPGCRTPCSVSLPAAEGLTVTYALDRYLPVTVPIQTIRRRFDDPLTQAAYGGGPEFDPNPVFVQLAPAVPPRRAVRRPPPKRVANRPPPAPSPGTASPFPPPPSSSPFPSR